MLFDVKDFFNSINRDILAQDILRIFKINEYFIEQSIEILDSAFIKNNEQYTIPLGFTISPLLSEVFMKSIDDKISEYCNNNKLIYTRYADDITISSQSRFSEHILIQEINEVLSEKQLILNNDKTRFSNLSKIGHYVKILGVYLTKKSHERKLYVSVGGKYIRNLAKEICGYRNSEISDADYKKKKIQGEIGFLHYVNHDDLIKLTKSVRAMVRDNQYEDLLAEYALYDDE
jgi:retron-type reverse transcriptase